MTLQHETFETALRRDGFDIGRQVLPAGSAVGEHAHPFDVRALVLSGEITLTFAGENYAFRAGDIFVMPAGQRHAETVGAEGVNYLVGRRRTTPQVTQDESRTS
jgi:quercetin dioxygenase-like cupin family protein